MSAPFPLQTQTAVITGAGNGVGAEIARALHAAGFRVILTDIDTEATYRLAEELDLASELALTATLDVSKPSDFQEVLDKVVDRWGSVEVLVNNAAVTRAQPLMQIDPADFNAVMGINAGGVFAGSQTFARHFIERGYGRIINMASLAGQNGGTTTGAHYAASKGAIMTLTKVFARDLAQYGITCNCISPGPLDSPMVHELVGENMPQMLRNIPVGRLGEPGFVGQMVAMLASPAAAFVNGACWDYNGGLYMR
ncbi:SDR family oxidoreductase [Pseudooceanicola sp. CBS1P-1]|uniref:SDR family oxidoreductase n=1 Tax=Pseudooceanicola albus TaxID=2692189 RepID=A0A6L7GB77_9RHOB|nr:MULTISPECIES: SDR family oxidoreductase [Pseudooceanicola]MBT9386497.1 SDR family oxidoreductase [Pseudooceanicola endophyticus]MXN20530.1 SDR family oxidoreductase [Pseudooceanicola albus]